MSARKPLAKTCAIIVRSQSRPAVTCRPWQPTSVKKADRKALRVGPGAARDHAGEFADLEPRKAAPSTKVARHGAVEPVSRCARALPMAREAAGEARHQKAGGLEAPRA